MPRQVQWIMAAILLLTTGLSVSTAAAQTTWRLVNEYPASSLTGEGDEFFAKAVADRSGGKLAIETILDAKSGLRTRDHLKAVATNTQQMASSFAGALDADDPIFLLSSLPFLTGSAADAKKLFDAARPAYERLLAARNQRLLYVSPWPPSGVWSALPLDRDGLARLKLRTYDTTGTALFKALGAQAMVVSFADLPQKLASGEFNAVLSSGDGGAGRKLWEYLKHFSEIQYATPLSFATVNLDAWRALDPATQAVVEAAAAATSERQWQALVGRVEVNYARMRENGMTIDRAPTSALIKTLRDAGAQSEREWLARVGDEGARILAAYRR